MCISLFAVGCSRRQYLPDSMQHWLSCASRLLCISHHHDDYVIRSGNASRFRLKIVSLPNYWQPANGDLSCFLSNYCPVRGLTHDITWYIRYKITSNHLLQLEIGKNTAAGGHFIMLASPLHAMFIKKVILMIPHTNFWWFCTQILTLLMIPYTYFGMIAWWKRCHPYTLLLAYIKILATKIT